VNFLVLQNNLKKIIVSKSLSRLNSMAKACLSCKSCLSCLILCLCISAIAQEKGKDARWESAGKQGIGTALSLDSKIWFTLQGGSLTEVFYPTVDKANVENLQFIVVNPKTKLVETERDDSIHTISALTPKNNLRIRELPESSFSLTFTQTNTAKSGKWKIRKTYVTDRNSDVIVINVDFECSDNNLVLYVYYDPSLNNSGLSDSAWFNDGVLLSNEGNIFSALAFSFGRIGANQFIKTTSDFAGKTDGLSQLRANAKLNDTQISTRDGNVVQVAQIPADPKGWTPFEALVGGSASDSQFTLALGFGDSEKMVMKKVRQTLFKGFKRTQSEYEQDWDSFIGTLPSVNPKYQTQFNFAAMALRSMEDKTFRGGSVASLSKPWIPIGDANGPYVGGYHLVWSRDLYQVATAYIALGDKDSANRALDYLFKYQQKPDGSYPQISWLDGRTLGDAIQMDEVSYPLILAYQLNRIDRETYEKHVKPTADFIAKNGPKTGQERWEEKSGYSPSTIAAEIAGLVCAADIATKNGDQVSAKIWLEKADDWAKNVEKWTATKTGKYGDGNYYIRLSAKGTPDAGDKIELNNNAGIYLENEIVDAGFLELVRLGIKSPNDPLIIKSLKVVDDVLKVKTPNGEGFYRYNHDGYGEMEDGRPWNFDRKYSGKGHLWALLTGERGQYEIALADSKLKPKNSKLIDPRLRLDAMLKFANDAYMIPEQVWDKPNGPFQFGEGAGSATPLAWSMAQFIRLAMNIKNGKNIDTPEVVARRYGNLK
jgi:glucoamylase